MTVPNPTVSVLMPVHNAAEFLCQSIESVLSQTLADFEFVIVDDASTDDSERIVSGYTDSRIRLIKNARKCGVAECLNTGLRVARGKYIARMDADDISLPTRFARQVAFMDEHPEIGVLGMPAQAFGDAVFTINYPTEHDALKTQLLFNTCFAHPTVMFRATMLAEGAFEYPYVTLEDYAFWSELVDKTTFANSTELGLRYRVRSGSVLRSLSSASFEEAYAQIDVKNLSKLSIDANASELALHNILRNPTGPLMDDAEQWLLRIRDANAKAHYYDSVLLDALLHDRWRLYCYVTHGWGPRKYLRYLRSPLSRTSHEPMRSTVATFLKFCVWKLFKVIR